MDSKRCFQVNGPEMSQNGTHMTQVVVAVVINSIRLACGRDG